MKAYKLFDYTNDGQVSFLEFLLGIYQFTKGSFEEKVSAIFRLYLFPGEEKIEMKHFLMMIYNFPYKDIQILLQQNNQNDLSDENYWSSFSAQKSSHNQTMIHDFDDDQNQEENQRRKSQFNAIVLKWQSSNQLSNQIKDYVESIFFWYSWNKPMNYNQFQNWIEDNLQVLKIFESWFYPEFWLLIENSQKELVAGYENLKPKLVIQAQVKFPQEILYKKRQINIYEDFLFFFELDKQKNNRKLINIIFLRGIFVSNEDRLNKIRIWIDPKEKSCTKIKADQQISYSKLLIYMQKYAVDQKESQYWIIRKIGKGKFSNVFLIQNKQNGLLYALKKVYKKNLSLEEKMIVENEARILQTIKHPFVIQLIDYWENSDSFNYILEYIKGENINQLVKKSNGQIEESLAKQIIKKILQAFISIKQHGIVHRDLKPENIIVELNQMQQIKVKIIDFGFSIFKDEQKPQEREQICGTPNFIAPEIYLGEKYDYSSDIYSLGIIMVFMLTGELPFNSHSRSEIINKTLHQELDHKFFSRFSLSFQAQNLIWKMLEKDPRKRIAISQAIHHEWFNSFHSQNNLREFNTQIDLKVFI